MAIYDTYLANLLRIETEVGENWIELRPGQPHVAPVEPLHIVPAWNPWGEQLSLGRNIAARERLEVAVLCLADEYRLGAAFDPQRSWAEETLAFPATDDQTVARVAAEHGQWIFWRWDERGLHLLEYGWGAVLDTVPVGVRGLTRRLCPLRIHDGGPSPCSRDEFGVDSTESAIAFDRRRVTFFCTVGCDTCEHGRLLERPVDPDPDHAWLVPSRHDGVG